jgi:DNA-3-methyladenine glycosylase
LEDGITHDIEFAAANSLPIEFYARNTEQVARELLGKILVHASPDGIIAATIVETEAYVYGDAASHAYAGPTKRNKVMFGPVGFLYVYLSYGIHDMVNIVTGAKHTGEAVLLRAAMPVAGLDTIRHNRSQPTAPAHKLASGPGRLAQAFSISRHLHNGASLTNHQSSLWVSDGEKGADFEIVTTTRIGITKAADKPLRFYILGNAAVSRK